MSVHNGERFLAQSLESILQQTFEDFEFLIIDDASTDRSPEILANFQKRDPRIHIIQHEKNLGLTVSLNEGLAQAKGRLIARHDADDISRPDRLQKQKAYLDQHPEIFLCATNVDIRDGQNTLIEKSMRPRLTPAEIAAQLQTKNCLLHPTVMFRNDGSRYREKFYYAQDYDFYLLALTAGKQLALLPEKLVEYRLGEGAISYRNRTHQRQFAKQARIFFAQRRQNGKDDYESFQQETILSLPKDPNAEERLEVDLVTFYLQNGKAALARQTLARATHLSVTNRLLLAFFTGFPALYRWYRKFRYSDHETL